MILFRLGLQKLIGVVLLTTTLTVVLCAKANAEIIKAKNTEVFFVGVLKWKSAELESFTDKNRIDLQLFNRLKALSQDDSAVFLKDEEATLSTIKSKLNEQLSKTKSGDTFVFYYCGHGWVDRGAGYLANYDAGDTNEECLSIKDIVKAFDEKFKGDKVLFLADCCSSGAFVKALKNSKFKSAVLTSATQRESSTDNWTFSRSVLDTLEGHPSADENKDGQITLLELGKYISSEMKQFEKQKGTVWFSDSLNTSEAFAPVLILNEPCPQTVKVRLDGEWKKAKMLGMENGKARIRWVEIGKDSVSDESLVDPADVRILKRIR